VVQCSTARSNPNDENWTVVEIMKVITKDYLGNDVVEEFTNLGARASGKASRNCSTFEGNFEVKLDVFNAEQEFKYGNSHGLQKFKFRNPLNCFSKDYSFTKEKITSDLMTAAGVLAPRIVYTDLYINGKYYGLYLIQETFDHRFFKNRGDALVSRVYDSNTRKHEYVYGDFLSDSSISQTQEINSIVQGWRDEKSKIQFYVDSFMLMVYVNGLVNNIDGFPFNNFYLYKNPITDKWIPIAYDFDLTFSHSDPFEVPYYRNACSTEDLFFDTMLPTWKTQLPSRILALAKVANSSNYHQIDIRVVQNVIDFFSNRKNLVRPCHANQNDCWKLDASNLLTLQFALPICLNRLLIPKNTTDM
jgi:hypothetical protein